MKSKKTNKLIFKTDRDSDKENKFMVTKAEREGEIRSLRLADMNYYI